ncbi:hypothetical protein SAMN05443575_2188 [Jatrophihabitans endophyticus]|uniref:Uncharacterized protein n=1 Tax=Jatrophihabitans endophyticus TaxID=1206085 RepID=A0A1M5KKU5_9ACTN|nr:hypothetical protein [Jatrophihabitans endophyticus]SHG53391.1 hypothetical protein SAMN05443575_2188 [Jatrophihabitans endophyticus]
MPDESDAVAAAADRLYAAPVDDFTAVRGDLAREAKAAGDAATAKAVAALRKPTVAASVVNRYALHERGVVAQLTELGDTMRRAQQDLDADRLRELSTRRRALVAEVTRAALAHVGRPDPPAALHDEVSATFDAAVADPDVAGRLGRLLRPERFSGFGVAPGPGLTLVAGDGHRPRKAGARASDRRTAPTERATAPEPPAGTRAPAAPAPPKPAARRRLARRVDAARTAFDDADRRHDEAAATERRAAERIRELGDELAALQRELDEAKTRQDAARREVRDARSARREARSALDRAERAQQRGE